MRIRVVYDDSKISTSVVDADTGQVIPGVRRIRFEHTVGEFPILTLDFIKRVDFEATVAGSVMEDITEVGAEFRRLRLKPAVAP